VRLTQIKLAGFKSFVDPTVIPIPSQLVGVVGPNGCGKSNIIDAVRWVLGETRAAELRGESMQDVIFNGSGERKAAARASVELVFDNSQGRSVGQWSSYAEIAVKRVLTRDGASSYWINQQPVRRRDIHDMFLGTGLGARGYAIIGQGMISRLIEARPEELRVYLEEAAGVSRYKERRRETENRLADTRENLIRVEDILRELNTQVEKLQAQAQVAQRYRALQDEGEQKQHALWLLRESAAQAERKDKAAAIEAAETELQAATARLRHTEAELEARRAAQQDANDAVHAAQGVLFEAGAQASRLEADIRHVVDARARLAARRAQLQQQSQQWAEQQQHHREQIKAVEAQAVAARDAQADAHRALQDLHAQLPEAQAQLHKAESARETLRAQRAQVEQALALSAQAQRDAERQRQTLEQRRARLHSEARALPTHDPHELERLAGEQAQTQGLLHEAQARVLELEAQLPERDAARTHARALAQAENQTLAHLEAHHAALVKVQNEVQQHGELHAWLEQHELSALGRLWQQMHIETGWETALESVLRERLSALPLRQLEAARAFRASRPPARLAFYQKPRAAPLSAATSSKHPTLASLLRLADPDLHYLLQDWLREVYTATDMEAALAARADLPAGGVFVLPDGHQIDQHSVRFYAADSEQAGMLARQQEIENLQGAIKAQRMLADQATAAAAQAEHAWRAATQALAPARTRAAELSEHLHAVQLRHTQVQHRAEQSTAARARLSEELDELAAHIEELHARQSETEARFESLDEELAHQQSRYAEAQDLGETLARAVETLQTQVRAAERRAQEADFAERTHATRIAELQRHVQVAQDQAARAAADLEDVQGELFSLDESAAQAGLQDALERRARCEDAVRQARIHADALSAALREADAERLRLEHALDPLRARITQLQLQEQQARLTLEQYAEQLNSRQSDRAALRALIEGEADTWRDPAWLHAEVQRIARQMDALGAVNLAALDELSTAQERQGFLDAQVQDLNLAIDTLEAAIRKIDRETRALLQATFDAVNREFGELFPQLFGGGQARLTMTGEEILDAGVQVMAQPPGKRNSTIHLLSGGEKALTATALVFALFKLKPAPFCLLDEVDAPLDDANTERYANLVQKMSAQTQFLFISHNKIAMQMAQQLVGVTMQEQGVSRIVAVDMDAALQWVQA